MIRLAIFIIIGIAVLLGVMYLNGLFAEFIYNFILTTGR